MNNFGVSNTILYTLFVYVLFFSKWILVESNPTFGGSTPSFGAANKTGVDLILKAKKATDQFNYEKSGQVVTYTAKNDYAFKSVKTGKKGETVVWSTDKEAEYASKVVLDGKGKKEKKVTIQQPDGTKKIFKRDGKGKPWTTVSQQSNQTTGQPGSGTPASGTSQPVSGSSQSASEGTRGGTTQSLGNEGSGTHTGGGSRGMTGSHGMSSGGRDPENHGSQGSTQPSGGAPTSGGTQKRGSDGSASNPPEAGGSSTTPPASEGSGKDASAGGEDNSKGNEEASSKGENEADEDDQGCGNPADSPNDLMKQFEKLVGKELKQKDYPDNFKFFKADPNDANSTVELTKSEYKVKFDVDEHIYVFYYLNCTLIKHKDKEVWKYGSTNSDSTTDGSTTPDPTKTGSSTDGSTIPDGTNSSSTTPDPKKSGSTTPDGTKSDPKSNTKYPKGMNVEQELMFIYFNDHTKVYSMRSDEWQQTSKVEKDLSKLKVIADSKDKDRD